MFATGTPLPPDVLFKEFSNNAIIATTTKKPPNNNALTKVLGNPDLTKNITSYMQVKSMPHTPLGGRKSKKSRKSRKGRKGRKSRRK